MIKACVYRFFLRMFGGLQLTIRGRIWLLNAVAILALLSIIFFSLLQTHRTQLAIQHIIHSSFPGVLLITGLESDVHRLHAYVVDMTMEADGGRLQQDQLQIEKTHSKILKMLDQCKFLLLSDRQHGLLEELQDEIKSYFQEVRNVHEMAAAGNLEIAQAVLVGSVNSYLMEIQQVVENLRIEAGRNQEDDTAALDRAMQHSLIRFGGVAFIAVLLLLSFGMVLQRRILQPLRQMDETILKITQNLDFTLRVPQQGNDEVGRSMKAFNGLLATLQESLGEMIAVIQDSIQATETMHREAQVVEQIAESGTNASTGIHAAAENIAEHIQKIARHSREAADITTHSGHIAAKNAAIIRSGVAEIDGVEGTVRQAAERIFAMVDAGRKIGSVVDDVKKITKQTNLLALNATIEAARAGEVGRGFKIVAGEVKSLAEDTDRAAREIGCRVVDMQTISKESAAAMEQMIDSVKSGVSATRPAGEAIGEIERETQQVLTVVAAIAQAIEAGEQAEKEIIRQADAIAALLHQAQSAAHRTADSADNIQTIARNLTNIINRFRISHSAQRNEVICAR